MRITISVRRNGQIHGPFTLEEIKELLQEGAFDGNDLALHEGCRDWTPLGEALLNPILGHSREEAAELRANLDPADEFGRPAGKKTKKRMGYSAYGVFAAAICLLLFALDQVLISWEDEFPVGTWREADVPPGYPEEILTFDSDHNYTIVLGEGQRNSGGTWFRVGNTLIFCIYSKAILGTLRIVSATPEKAVLTTGNVVNATATPADGKFVQQTLVWVKVKTP